MNLKFHIHIQLLIKHTFSLYNLCVFKHTKTLLINRLINVHEIW